MSGPAGKVPYVKFTDPQLEGETRLSGRLYTGLLWSLLFAACFAVCLYYCMVKTIVITSANVSGDELVSLSEAIYLSVAEGGAENTVTFSVPAGVRASDIVTENLYNERRFLVHINTGSEGYYGSLSEAGVAVDAGRITGDPGLVNRCSVIYDRTGALLVFDMSYVYEYVLSIDEDTVTMEAVSPSELYDFVVVMDPEDSYSAAGVLPDVAGRCEGMLAADGIKVYVTDACAAEGKCISAADLTDETGADIYIGMGVSHDGPDHHGIKTYYDPVYYIPGYGSTALCETCLKAVAIAVSDKACGIGEAPEGSILYDINVPAVYITLGNSDNSRENELMTDDSYREKLAKGLYQAVLEAAGNMGEESWRD
ncbi:MAG: N-acetylmuramoyl-L-alanine amidase [Lachnospiraceae bacterium]|nr:N-acetylmuramoyl-L-alanine amidase [Lachnospiraceae bacterium]